MKTRIVSATLSVVLCAALTAPASAADPWAQTSKRELWDSGRRYRSKWLDALDDRDICLIRHGGCLQKLATRTSTAIQTMVVPPTQKEVPGGGASAELVVIIGLGCLILGGVFGYLLADPDAPPTVIVAK